MEEQEYIFRKLGREDRDRIRELFVSVFTAPLWNDDWSDRQQLDRYLEDLTGQSSSLAFGLFDGEELVGVSMGSIKHWWSGTEYCIEELCVKTCRQRQGLGTFFLKKIRSHIAGMGLKHLFLQTERTVPAYEFYLKNGFKELKDHVSLAGKTE